MRRDNILSILSAEVVTHSSFGRWWNGELTRILRGWGHGDDDDKGDIKWNVNIFGCESVINATGKGMGIDMKKQLVLAVLEDDKFYGMRQ